MPRKSHAQLDIEDLGLAAQPVFGNIDFPSELATDAERVAYQRVIEANPSPHLYSAAVEPLLIAYVRHSISAGNIAEVIRSIDKAADPKLFLSLLRAAKDESMAMASLSTKLKISPSSTANHRGNRSRTDQRPKPWEVGG